MHPISSYADALQVLRRGTGVVIPVYFPDGVPAGPAIGYLEDTIISYLAQVEKPLSICLSVDGPAHGREIAAALAARHGVAYVVADRNRGKFQAAANGVRHLLLPPCHRFVAIVDQDGDHFANELINLVRAALHVQTQTAGERVLALGRRISKHRPLGFSRGELEEIADRVLLDALHYHAAISGHPLRLEYATAHEEYPDFHSGFKLFDRATAADTFLREPILCGVDADCYYRHGCEATMIVEAHLAGAVLCPVNRSTFNEQPVSTFGLMHRQTLVANKMIWAVKRLGVPPEFARQWYDNHLPRLLLGTIVPDGQQVLLDIRRLLLAGLGLPDNTTSEYRRPLFV